MVDFEVIVVGAGPAGLSAAKTLAEKGVSVLCLDKKQEIGNPVRCAEGLSLRWFEKCNLKPDPSWAVCPIYGAALYSPTGKQLVIRSEKVSGYVLERKIFEKFLAREAAKLGAKFRVKSDVLKAERKNGCIDLTVNELGEEKKYSCHIVIAADGVDSCIARMLGLNTVNKLNDIDSGFQYEMAGIEFENPDLINLFFGNNIAPRGYVWIFPKGKHEANVGIGIAGTRQETAKYYLDRFIENHKGLCNGSIVEVNAGAVPVGGFLDSMVKDNLMVCGDAAHQVNPIHGGGIGIAMDAARTAAEVAAEAIKSKDYSEKFLSKYNERWYAGEGNRLKNILKKRYMMEEMSDSDFETIIDSLTGEEVAELAEGEFAKSAKIVITKLVKKPALLKVMLKYLKP